MLATLAAGCATTAEPTASAPPAAPAPGQAPVRQDHAYMQQVEQIARRRGIGVMWVNPPTTRGPRTDD
jgi:hypothetical protein